MSFYTFLLLIFIGICYGDIYEGQVILDISMAQSLKLKMDTSANTVQIQFAGDANYWFGVGFNGTDMMNTYSFVVDGDYSNTIYELKLGSGDCSPGCDKQLNKSYTVNLNNRKGSLRTINITRSIIGNNNNYYTFPTTPTSIPLIFAYGNRLNSQFEQSIEMGNAGLSTIKLVQQ